MPNSETWCVVGSGPAGIACALGLVAAGKDVTIFDSGAQLEPARREACVALASAPASNWTPDSLAFLKEGVTSSSAGIPLKLAYGSDFPYRQVPGSTSIASDGVDTKPSYARGGLSSVWGSAVLPHRQEDIADWPISIKDLEPGYRAVLQFMPLSARHDDLTAFFPLYSDRSAPLPMSRQATALLATLERRRARLNAHGVYFGSSRLAVNASDSNARPLCVQCGLCMFGCPHNLIYSSDQTLATLLATNRVRYKPGVTVQSVHETRTDVLIRAVDSDGRPVELSASHVFLAAGTMNTTAILLRSLEQYDMPVQMRDSQYFLLPLLRLPGTAHVVREPLHTLAQLFIEVFDRTISPYTIHLQTYTYNELFRDAILAKLGPLKDLFPMEAFLGRLLLFQGYLHSSHSASISATLQRGQSGDTLHLLGVPNPDTSRCVAKLSRKLMKLARSTGVVPLTPLLQMGKPGRGFHSGGGFPMSVSPGAQETDTLGRPRGLTRVHAVDSTVLPSIPATTITFTVMANAYRIGHVSGSSQ